jgi:hypothetical protein
MPSTPTRCLETPFVLEGGDEVYRRENPLGIPRTAEAVAAFEAQMPWLYGRAA